MKQFLLFSLLVSLSTYANAQQLQRTVIKIKGLKEGKAYEFSALVQGDTAIYLVPTMKKGETVLRLYVINKQTLEAARLINGPVKEVAITDSINFNVNNFTAMVTNKPNYDGIEAVVIKGNDIWLAAEDTGAYCYIYKGIITATPNKEIIITRSLALPKPKAGTIDYENYKNDGFESLVLFGDSLMAFFEKKCGSRTIAYNIHPDLNTLPVPVTGMGAFMDERLSDIALSKDSLCLIGITITYNFSDISKNIYRLQELSESSFSDYGILSSGRNDLVWEGIIAYRDGYLLINDNSNAGSIDETQLLFVIKN